MNNFILIFYCVHWNEGIDIWFTLQKKRYLSYKLFLSDDNDLLILTKILRNPQVLNTTYTLALHQTFIHLMQLSVSGPTKHDCAMAVFQVCWCSVQGASSALWRNSGVSGCTWRPSSQRQETRVFRTTSKSYVRQGWLETPLPQMPT